MKCFEFDQLAAYVDEVLSQEEKKHVEKHLEFCPSCREVVSALQKEDAFPQEAIQSPVLPAGFDGEVLSKLEPYQARKKKRNWPYQLLTAASIVLVLGVGAAFYSGTKESDGGNASLPVFEEEKEALFSVKDEGVLLEVTDISASPLKIEVFYRLKPEEWVLEDFLKKHNVQHIIQVHDEYERMPPNAQIVDANGQELPFREVAWGGNDRFQNSIVIKPGEMENLPDSFKMQFQFEELFLQEGAWKLEIPIDIREAKEKTSKNPISFDYLGAGFTSTFQDWETSTNAHILTLTSEYLPEEKERIQNLLNAREEGTEEYSMIMPELKIVAGDREQSLIPDGISSFSNMGQSFTTEFEFTNRVNGRDGQEELSLEEELKLVVQGFRIHEPENTQFELTDQSENVQVNNWIIDSVTTEPETENAKLVTITGRTSIENVENFTVEVKGDNKIINTEIISNRVTPEGTFVFQTNMPISTETYNIDIQSITKWVPFEKEVPLKK
jgi:hypothetical protein